MLRRGEVVRSQKGRDKGRYLVVLESTEQRIMVVDGKERRLARPKPKNPRHLEATGILFPEATLEADTRLRKALNRLQTIERSTGR